MKTLLPAERLIVAADFKPDAMQGRGWVHTQVLQLARDLKGTGVYLKVNSGLRSYGYDLIDEIHAFGLKVFADLKLFDIGETLATDGALLLESKPEIVTTVCTAGIAALRALKTELPETEVLGVTVLTSLKDIDTEAMFSCSIKEGVMRFAQTAFDSQVNGLVCAPTELEMLRAKFGPLFSLNAPAIRPAWAIVANDDQNPDRIMTPAKAIKAGADRIVVGRPIVRAEKPYDAVMRTIDEIAAAMT